MTAQKAGRAAGDQGAKADTEAPAPVQAAPARLSPEAVARLRARLARKYH